MRVGIRDAERLKDSPSSAPVCALGHLPPCGGRLWGCSNREGLIPLWDVWIHILGIWVECACWGGAGGPGVPSLKEREWEPAPSSAPFGGTFPQGGRLGKNKKGQVWDLPLKMQRRNAVSHKISLLTFFFKESKRPRFTTGASYLCVL